METILRTIQNWGWACEQVIGIDVVTAAGESIHCSETENADLFWCARGAGPGRILHELITIRFLILEKDFLPS